MKSVPPMSDLFNMAGLNLPEYLGKKKEADAPVAQAEEIKEDKKKK
jgi:flotillin